MKRNTERHIPAGYELVAKDERFNFEVWGIESPAVIAKCFAGKAVNPTWHYRFKDITRRNAEIEKTLRNLMEHQDRKEKRQAEKKAADASHNVKAGDIFRCSWGYDQTNIDYYQVVSVTGQMAIVQEIAQEAQETGFMSGECVPSPDSFIGKPKRVRIQKYSLESEPYFKAYSFANAYRMKPVAMLGNKPVFKASHWTAYA